jgi:hypothetical protein
VGGRGFLNPKLKLNLDLNLHLNPYYRGAFVAPCDRIRVFAGEPHLRVRVRALQRRYREHF